MNDLAIQSDLAATDDLLRWLNSAFSDLRIDSDDGKVLPKKVPAALALFHQTIEHAFAIARLFNGSPLCGSAFSLVRPQFESLIRGPWILHSANANQLDRFIRDDKIDFTLEELITQVEGAHIGFSLGHLSGIKNSTWKTMCSFAHSGAMQLVRRIGDGFVGPNYGAQECRNALRATRLFGIFAAFEVTALAARDDVGAEALRRLAKEFGVDLKELGADM